jgi:hypothetical protein
LDRLFKPSSGHRSQWSPLIQYSGATQSPAAPRLTPTPGRHIGSWLEALMLWIIILIVAIAAILYTQRERLSNLRR